VPGNWVFWTWEVDNQNRERLGGFSFPYINSGEIYGLKGLRHREILEYFASPLAITRRNSINSGRYLKKSQLIHIFLTSEAKVLIAYESSNGNYHIAD